MSNTIADMLYYLGYAVPGGAGISAAARARNTAAESVAAGQRGAENFPSVAAPTEATQPPVDVMPPPEPPARPTVPVATPAGATSPATRQGELPPSARDLLARLQAGQAAPNVGTATATAAAGNPASAVADPNSNPLARFGFAMAASRNPSLFGQIGEAGLSMLQGQRENRQDTNREAEVDVMRNYRQAQMDLARAEQEWQRDPSNPRAIALLAEARYREAAAAHVGQSGGGGGGSGGPFVQIQNPETGEVGFFQPRTGNVVRAPEGFGRVGEAGREEMARQRDITAFGNMNRNSPTYIVDPSALMRDAQAYADQQAERRNRTRTPTSGTTTPAPTAGGETPARIIDLTPRSR